MLSQIQGIETVIDLTTNFRLSIVYDIDFNYLQYIAVSDDGAGNTILLHNKSDNIFLFDHDNYTLEVLCDSFETLIENNI